MSKNVDKEEEMVEEVARLLANSRLSDTVLEIILKSLGMTNILGSMAYLFVSPYLTAFLGESGRDFSNYILLNPSANIDRILDKVKELRAVI
jgi:hypothetical protein